MFRLAHRRGPALSCFRLMLVRVEYGPSIGPSPTWKVNRCIQDPRIGKNACSQEVLEWAMKGPEFRIAGTFFMKLKNRFCFQQDHVPPLTSREEMSQSLTFSMTQEFFVHANSYLGLGLAWPCVRVDRVVYDTAAARCVPMHFEHLDGRDFRSTDFIDIVKSEREKAEAAGLPVIDRPLEESRRSFIAGLIDTVMVRARALSFHTSDRNVTVLTTPSGETILFSKGHFFSTGKVFGYTQCTEPVKTGTFASTRRAKYRIPACLFTILMRIEQYTCNRKPHQCAA